MADFVFLQKCPNCDSSKCAIVYKTTYYIPKEKIILGFMCENRHRFKKEYYEKQKQME